MEKNTSDYVVYDVQMLEVPNKAQVKVFAHLVRKELETKAHLENALLDIYNKHKQHQGFQHFSAPTVVNVYLYTSERLGRENAAAWIGMLRKGPNEAAPLLSIDEWKFNSQSALEANAGTVDEVELEKLHRLLFDRGLELCSFNRRLRELESECIRQADEQYPGYGEQHQARYEELHQAARQDVCRVHDLDEPTLGQVHVFAMTFCK